MYTEIAIKKSILTLARMEMANLSKETSNKIVKISLDKSKGDTIDQLKELEKQLNLLRGTLAHLYSNTEKVIAKTLTQFEKNDNAVANYFKFMEETEK